jgi:tetratricopeptide (TPR) repeat protein
MELAAEGMDLEAQYANRQAVRLHREALETWPDASAEAVLESYFGESHIVQAYAALGAAQEWITSVEGSLDSPDGMGLAPSVRAIHLGRASDLASQAGYAERAGRLARTALDELGSQQGSESQRMQTVRLQGNLVRATAASGDSKVAQRLGDDLEGMLEEWARLPAGVLEEARDVSLAAAYNDAARTFVVVQDWERAIQVARRAAELWDMASNHWFLAVSLWVGRRDRCGALEALRKAARDTRLSGRGECRNLRDDFVTSVAFADVRDDPEFLAAIAVVSVAD